MTEQRSPEERTQEIILGALEVLDERGLTGLTMEAVIARTSLSKGGVYRFYGSKQELIIDVLKHIAEAFRPVEKEEALSWNLPLKETLVRLLFSIFYSEEGRRFGRIHIQLMPQLPLDDPLTKSMKKQLDNVLVRYGDIVQALVRRDQLKAKPGFKKTMASAINIGQSLFDGLMINSLSGIPISELKMRMSSFIDLVIQASVEGYPNS